MRDEGPGARDDGGSNTGFLDDPEGPSRIEQLSLTAGLVVVVALLLVAGGVLATDFFPSGPGDGSDGAGGATTDASGSTGSTASTTDSTATDEATTAATDEPTSTTAPVTSPGGTSDLPNTLVVESAGQGAADYQLSVSGDLETVQEEFSSGGRDVYRYSGEITRFEYSGDVRVSVNGEEVDPDDLGE